MDYPYTRKAKLGVGEVSKVLSHDSGCCPGNCNLDDVVVGFVGKIRSPDVVDPDPSTSAQEGVKQRLPLFRLQRGSLKQIRSGKYGFVLREEACTHQRIEPTLQASSYHLSARTLRPQNRRDEDVRIHHDSHCRHDSICAVIPAGWLSVGRSQRTTGRLPSACASPWSRSGPRVPLVARSGAARSDAAWLLMLTLLPLGAFLLSRFFDAPGQKCA